jgi:hypothetical protein
MVTFIALQTVIIAEGSYVDDRNLKEVQMTETSQKFG